MSILNRGHARHGVVVPKIASVSQRAYGYASCYGGTPTTLALSADVFYAIPFYLRASTAIDLLSLNVTVAAAAGKLLRLGIYSATQPAGLPDALLYDSGALAADTAAPFIAAPSGGAVPALTLVAGLLYYLAVVTNGAPTVTAITPIVQPYGATSASDTAQRAYLSRAFTYAALPAAWGTHTAIGGNIPNIVVRAV